MKYFSTIIMMIDDRQRCSICSKSSGSDVFEQRLMSTAFLSTALPVVGD